MASWHKTRARIGAEKRWHPDNDLSELYVQMAMEVEEEKIRRMVAEANLTDNQRRELAVLLLTKEKE